MHWLIALDAAIRSCGWRAGRAAAAPCSPCRIASASRRTRSDRTARRTIGQSNFETTARYAYLTQDSLHEPAERVAHSSAADICRRLKAKGLRLRSGAQTFASKLETIVCHRPQRRSAQIGKFSPTLGFPRPRYPSCLRSSVRSPQRSRRPVPIAHTIPYAQHLHLPYFH